MTDNGTLYVNDVVAKYCKKESIFIRCIRAHMIQYDLDDYFWKEILC